MSDDPTPIDLTRQADFALGDLQVRPSTLEVACGAWRELLEPKVMQVLVALAEAEGAVVSRNDLIARCWEGRVVGEDAINRAIGRLRRLSEADAGASFAIETVPRVGYRLVAGTTGAMPGVPAATEGTGHAASPKAPLLATRWTAPALIVLALLVAGSLAAWWLLRPGEWVMDEFHVAISSPLFENDPAIAPNGSLIAYAAGPAPSAWHIFVRNLSDGQPIQLTNGPEDDDIRPAWSPDSSRIAFVRHREGLPCTIMIKPVPAGDEHIAGHCREDDFSALVWSPKGDALYFADRPEPHLARRVMRLNLADGSIEDVTHPPADIVGDREASISPDGGKIVFLRRAKGVTSAIVRDLASGVETPLAEVPDMNAQKAWVDNDTLIAGTGGLTRPALWVVPLHGVPQKLAVNSQALGSISAGPNGTFAIETFRAQAVLASPPATDGARPDVLQASNGVSFLPAYSAGGRLAFLHIEPGGLPEIWTQNPGEPPHQLSTLGAHAINGVRWSPDGKQLAFYAVIGAQHGFFTLNADGTGLRSLGQHGTVGMPEWAADGHALLVPMKDDKGWRIWRIGLSDPGHAVPVTPYGWFAAHPGPGGALYAMGTNAPGIWRIDGVPKFIARFRRRCTENFIECQSWSVIGDTVLFGDHSERANPRIILHSLKDGSERSLPAPGMDNNDDIAMDPVTGKVIYAYDGLGDSDIALFHLTRK